MQIERFSDPNLDFRYVAELAGTLYNDGIVIKTDRADTVIRVFRRRHFSTEYMVTIEHANRQNSSKIKSRIKGVVSLLDQKPHKKLGSKVFEPHAYVAADHRGQGLVEGVYRWLLNNGFTLRSGAVQTNASNSLWKKLSKEFKLSTLHCQTDEMAPYTEGAELTSFFMRLVLQPEAP